MQIKRCSKCKIEKLIANFSKCRPNNKDSFRAYCKSCDKNYQREYVINNKEKATEYAKEYYKTHKEKVLEHAKDYYRAHKEKVLEYARMYAKEYRKTRNEQILDFAKKYYIANKEKVVESVKKYQAKHKKEINQRQRAYNKKKWRTDAVFKLSCNLRTRIYDALKNNSKSKHTMELIGCSIDFLKQHLEKQFYNRIWLFELQQMSWENYGKRHIDHIKPCASFDLTIPEEQKKCFHYTNLQPLWAEENQSKGSKVIYRKLG